MRWMSFLFTLLLLVSSQPEMYAQDGQLSDDEINQIKSEIIERAEKQANDLNNLDYKEIMTFYADVDDFIVFGDGYYWGDYITIDLLWQGFTKGIKENKWEFFNPKIHVFSKDIASLLVEFNHERVQNGEIKGGHGCFSFGMQKIDGDWKVVTMHVTHNYDVFNAYGEVRKWWLNLSPENRNKKE